MFLNNVHIKNRLAEVITFPDPADAESLTELRDQVRESHLELRLGSQVFITEAKVPKFLSDDKPFITVPPGEFALLTTYEEIHVPKAFMAFISIKFRYKALGLVNISGFHVDPDFKGRIVFSVYNVGPSDIILRYKDPIFLIFLAQLIEPFEGDREGKFQGQRHLPIDIVMSLRGAGVSLTQLQTRLVRLEVTLLAIGGVFVTVLGIVIALLVRFPLRGN